MCTDYFQFRFYCAFCFENTVLCVSCELMQLVRSLLALCCIILNKLKWIMVDNVKRK